MSKKLLMNLSSNSSGDSSNIYGHYKQSITIDGTGILTNNKVCATHSSHITSLYGNMTQDENDPSDIKHIGVLQEDGTYKIDIITSNQNHTQSNAVSFSLSKPLMKINDYIDYMYFDYSNKDYILYRKINSVIFDGSSDEKWNFYTSMNNNYVFYTTLSDDNKDSILMCDKFFYITGFSDQEGIYHDSDVNIIINKDKLTGGNVTAFKTWLSQNPITVYYILKNISSSKLEIPKIETNFYENYSEINANSLQFTKIDCNIALKEKIENEQLTMFSGFILSNGDLKTYSTGQYARTDYIDVSDKDTVTVKFLPSEVTLLTVATYNSSKTLLSYKEVSSSTDYSIDTTGVSYIALDFMNNNTSIYLDDEYVCVYLV